MELDKLKIQAYEIRFKIDTLDLQKRTLINEYNKVVDQISKVAKNKPLVEEESIKETK